METFEIWSSQIPSPPRSFADLVAWAEIARALSWVGRRLYIIAMLEDPLARMTDGLG
jgi:hypothetical protein